MYAQQYGKTHVDKLILSAPVSRSHVDTEEARRTMIVQNLMDIYQNHSNVGCPWREKLSDKNRPSSITEATTKGDPAIETFCFLTEDNLNHIKNELTSLLNRIARDYGSTAFVGRFYNKLIKDDGFQYRDYPAEFFTALRQLESLGGGERVEYLNGGELVEYRFQQEVRQKKIDAAFFLGYYLMLETRPALTDSKGKEIAFDCWEPSPFLQSIRKWHEKYPQPGDGIVNGIVRRTCDRIKKAEKALSDPPSNGGSFRANAVFGVYDGITRWIFRLLEDQGRTKNGCFKGKDLRDVARGHLFRDKEVIQEVAKTIGVSNDDEEICPWDAAKYRHNVDTLILTGRADPVTAGGQAMYFYENGLSPTKRVLIDFPGAGHEMSLQVKVPFEKEESEKNPSEDEIAARISNNFGGLLLDFLRNTSGISEFIVSDKVKGRLSALGARCKADPLPTYLESPKVEPPCKPKLDDDSRQ